ncbi:MAG: hypothetical protein JXB34_10725, partial [Bacteroidales bacterium]|nr:hypothetical protein [Bacteroidales bacterium]
EFFCFIQAKACINSTSFLVVGFPPACDIGFPPAEAGGSFTNKTTQILSIAAYYQKKEKTLNYLTILLKKINKLILN